MRKNLIQGTYTGNDGRLHIESDWFSRGIPPNVVLGQEVYLDSSFGFANFQSDLPDACRLGRAVGCYDRATFVTGPQGKIEVGDFTILNGSTLISHRQITIGAHCMLAWGSVVADTWLDSSLGLEERREILRQKEALRGLPQSETPRPVILEDNVWVGFDAVILPGLRIGRGAVVGSKTIVREDVPPYAVVAGDPARIIRHLTPDDTEAFRQSTFRQYGFSP